MLPHSQPTRHIAREHHVSIPSTQIRARDLAGQAHPDPLLITADHQSAGLGRTGRHWESPPGGLWLTLLHPLPPDHHRFLPALGLRVGLALARTVSTLLRNRPNTPTVRLKWPNDVLLVSTESARKVGGVLVEIKHTAERSYALLGVGLNLNTHPTLFPHDLAQTATSVRAFVPHDLPLDAARNLLLEQLLDAIPVEGLDQARLREIRAMLWGVGEQATLILADGSRAHGTLLGLTDDGRLELIRDGERWLAPLSAELAPPTG